METSSNYENGSISRFSFWSFSTQIRKGSLLEDDVWSELLVSNMFASFVFYLKV